MFSHEKTVNFSVRNDTERPIKVKAGDKDLTLQPGNDVPVKLAVGVEGCGGGSSTHFTEGTVLTVVSPSSATRRFA